MVTEHQSIVQCEKRNDCLKIFITWCFHWSCNCPIVLKKACVCKSNESTTLCQYKESKAQSWSNSYGWNIFYSQCICCRNSTTNAEWKLYVADCQCILYVQLSSQSDCRMRYGEGTVWNIKWIMNHNLGRNMKNPSNWMVMHIICQALISSRLHFVIYIVDNDSHSGS